MRSSHTAHHHQHHHHNNSFTLPQIKISDFDTLLKPAGKRVSDDWENGVKALGNIPGYKYSAAFISSLRSNLLLSASIPVIRSPSSSQFNTPISTPTTAAFSHHECAALQHPSPLSISAPSPSPATTTMAQTSNNMAALASMPDPPPPSSSPTADIPALTYEVLKPSDTPALTSALKLIADSVAQQRQTAGRAIIFHPAVMSTVVVAIALAAQYIDWTIMITTGMGVIMAGLLGVRLLTSGYIGLAEEVNFGWLEGMAKEGEGGRGGLSDPSKYGGGSGEVVHKRQGSDGKGGEPVVIVSKWGEEIMGTVVVRFVKKERKGYVRAYTVRLRYRRKGVGEGLLEEAVKYVWGKGGRAVEFEEGHANSKMILPNFFNGVFRRNEKRAQEQLAHVVEAQRKEKNGR